MSRWWPGLLLGLAAAAVVLGPSLWASPLPLLGHPNLDNWSHAWGLDWFLRETAAFHLPWRIEGAAFPEERVLWYVDPVGALLVAPVWLIFGPLAACDALQVLQVTLAGLGGWLFGRALGGRGWVAGVAVATMPLLQTEIWNGVLEACWIAPIPLAGWLAARRSRWTGVMVGLAGVATPYHGLGAALLAGTLLFVGGPGEERPGWRVRLVDLALAGALAAVVAGPHAMAIAASFDTELPFVQRPLFSGFNEPSMRINAVDPVAFLRPGDFWSFPANLADPLSPPWRHTPYLGWVCMLLAGLAVARRWRLAVLLVPVALALVATLGFFAWHDGDWVTGPGGVRYMLPLGWINQAFEVTFQHHLRFVGVAIVILAGLADRGARRWGPVAALLVAAENLLVAPNCWPLASVDASLPAVYATIPDDGRAIVDLPADSGNGNRTNRYLYWQALHHHPVPWVNKVGSMGTASMNPTLRTWTFLSREGTVEPGTPGAPDPSADLDAALAELAAEGFGWVVFHPSMSAKGHITARHREVLDAMLGPPREVPSGELVWEIPPSVR